MYVLTKMTTISPEKAQMTIVAQVVNTFFAFIDPKISLPCPKYSAMGLCIQSLEISKQSHGLYIYRAF